MASQDGVIAYGQALEAGMTSQAVTRRVRSGEWRRLCRSVYLRADRTVTPAVQLRAAVFTAGTSALAHGVSAAWWYGLIDRAPKRHTVTVPRVRRVRASDFDLRRRDLCAADVCTVRRLRLTCIPLTVLETAVALPNGSVFLDRALQKHTSLQILWSIHERNRGRATAKAAEKLLHAAGEGGASEAERILHRLLRAADLTGWRTHVPSCGFEIDVAFVRERVAIEVDGWAWHRDADRFARDMKRQNILVNAGWRVLRFSWHHLVHEPDRVLRDITAALGR